MPWPWLQIIDAVMGVASFARGRAALSRTDAQARSARDGALDGDKRHLELERQSAERRLKIELLRQAGDREIGRLRFVAGVAAATLVGSFLPMLWLFARPIGATLGSRVMLGAGWALLLAALAIAFAGQSRVAGALDRIDGALPGRHELSSGVAGALAPWLIVAGLALVCLAVLVG